MRYLSILVVLLVAPRFCLADDAPPATQPAREGIVRLPHVQIDLKNKQIRVDCETLNPHMPLEFFCVLRGG
jgi:hypothetical protein